MGEREADMAGGGDEARVAGDSRVGPSWWKNESGMNSATEPGSDGCFGIGGCYFHVGNV